MRRHARHSHAPTQSTQAHLLRVRSHTAGLPAGRICALEMLAVARRRVLQRKQAGVHEPDRMRRARLHLLFTPQYAHYRAATTRRFGRVSSTSTVVVARLLLQAPSFSCRHKSRASSTTTHACDLDAATLKLWSTGRSSTSTGPCLLYKALQLITSWRSSTRLLNRFLSSSTPR